jgi:hypothetical protein
VDKEDSLMLMACLLGLLLFGTPPVEVLLAVNQRPILSPAHPIFAAPLWPKKREPFTSLQTTTWDEAENPQLPGHMLWKRQEDESAGSSWVMMGGRDSGLSWRDVDLFSPLDPAWSRTFAAAAPFGSLLREASRVRTSDDPAEYKGRQLARLVRPWMSLAQIHALFGEPTAILYEHDTVIFGRVIYADYGVAVELGPNGVLTARSLHGEAKAGSGYFAWLDWLQRREIDRSRRRGMYGAYAGDVAD